MKAYDDNAELTEMKQTLLIMEEELKYVISNNYYNYLEIKHGNQVYLNVYHISPINCFSQFIGIGIFHTGLEINNKEYGFGSVLQKEDISGIFIVNPKKCKLILKGILLLLI